ncbi:tRNA splicing endonuclease subunit sen2 [Pleurotus ostreatus]|uniref:tRNA-splicing endonuclease subunit Sen2 n=1 Tax=Pleurotus ostreatus TaxID=5322 RepID=A0A8H7A0L3_PLEOS|nr:tRNA splicing endonuclease subunit sen2 [Pleurotus ostreatus]KAF7430556.1 tRNA splicing endonuclease subunit sen2 [Pleurotus ostreatus]KAJ8694845.1 tRNA splicing endonuclease subunit sen2 [Pleurotus ostreatus]
MSLIGQKNKRGGFKGGARRNENNRIYVNPLPLVFTDPPRSRTKSILSLLGISLASLENPHCEGILDVATNSVWLTNTAHSMVLWRRGFFGKGNLSRSEPSWLARQINIRRTGGNQMTSEELTAKRRAERQQFKQDRAKAIQAAFAEAEVAFETEGRVVKVALSGPSIPSAATWKPSESAKPPSIPDQSTTSQDADHPVDEEEPPLEDMEHLQLTFAEAWFLLWTMDCLTILDAQTLEPMSIQQIWSTFQSIHLNPMLLLDPKSQPSPKLQLHFDNPFLIHYVAYHHYRSLGWVVKGGIKFCVDYLLYKRGPVFSHAEFAIVLCPVYEDEDDKTTSPFELQNTSPFSWSWLSTINRVNATLQKTLILTYITIPAKSRISPDVLSSPACLSYYSVREVVIRRFIPARMRD